MGSKPPESMAAHGAQVVGAVRDIDKAHAATEQVRAQAGSIKSDITER
jgi:hypothetical protein